ncbi:hypothetical protein [Actinophytocola sp.]|uniref:COG4315 family predicted lipoprotein n=1 Tax=Actinophytocola sp. TaxID=1872138 RepID=UPI0025C170D5|nr:hypothetical protein [Actinophytocola sp.]
MSMQDGAAVRWASAALRALALLGTATVVAACGSGGTTDDGTGAGDGGGDTSSVTVAVRTQDHPDLGKILVDVSGKTLYFAEQEEDGTVRCVDACLRFWFPAKIPDGAAPSVPGVTELDVLHRADNGQEQLTYQGKPLYTFQLDSSAGDADGNNLQDDFGGVHFVWHAVTVDGEGTPTPSPTPGNDGGYGDGPGGY